jgi:hypothetical protein
MMGEVKLTLFSEKDEVAGPKVCSVEGCARALLARSLCRLHYDREWRQINKEREAEKRQQRRATNPEKYREKVRKWRKEHPLKNREPDRRSRYKPKARFNVAQKSAQKAGRSWTITLDQYKELLSNNCFYCSGPLSRCGVGLDRIDNDRGYEFDNVLPACGPCNLLRNRLLTVPETKVVVDLLKQLRGGGRLWPEKD